MKNFFAKTKGVSREFVYFNAIVRENLKNEETIDLENIENDTEKKEKERKRKRNNSFSLENDSPKKIKKMFVVYVLQMNLMSVSKLLVKNLLF